MKFTETRIAGRMLNLAIDAYQKAWQPVYPVTLEQLRVETNPQFANIAVPSEVARGECVAVSFPSFFSVLERAAGRA